MKMLHEAKKAAEFRISELTVELDSCRYKLECAMTEASVTRDEHGRSRKQLQEENTQLKEYLIEVIIDPMPQGVNVYSCMIFVHCLTIIYYATSPHLAKYNNITAWYIGLQTIYWCIATHHTLGNVRHALWPLQLMSIGAACTNGSHNLYISCNGCQ